MIGNSGLPTIRVFKLTVGTALPDLVESMSLEKTDYLLRLHYGNASHEF